MIKNIEKYMKFISEVDVEWVQKHIHPYVIRTKKDTDASYLRKMALFLSTTLKLK